MLVASSLDEVKRRETALNHIASLIKKEGRSALFDLTGLAGGFPLNDKDVGLLETYAGPALFEEDLDQWGKKHLGGEKLLAFNRTSSGILATIMALVKPGKEVLHYLPQKPSHPSIPRSCHLIGASYREYEVGESVEIKEDTALLVITGSTMDHQIIPLSDFKKSIQAAHDKGVPVLVDDASGARLRTVINHQPRATDLGADLAITSTDKLMEGPRGGLMAGKSHLINEIKAKAYQFGLEAQPPLLAAMARALEKFNPENLTKAIQRKDELYDVISSHFQGVEKTPTGVMITSEALFKNIPPEEIVLTPSETSMVWAMLLLKEENILTIPAVGMPGASATIRLDMAAADAALLTNGVILESLLGAFNTLLEVSGDMDGCRKILYC